MLIEKLKDEPMDKQGLEFIKAVTLNKEQIDIRYRLLFDLETLIKRETGFDNATLHPFGSFLSGISSANGDIDVFVDISGGMN